MWAMSRYRTHAWETRIPSLLRYTLRSHRRAWVMHGSLTYTLAYRNHPGLNRKMFQTLGACRTHYQNPPRLYKAPVPCWACQAGLVHSKHSIKRFQTYWVYRVDSRGCSYSRLVVSLLGHVYYAVYYYFVFFSLFLCVLDCTTCLLLLPFCCLHTCVFVIVHC